MDLHAAPGKVVRPPFSIAEEYLVVVAQDLPAAVVARDIARTHRGQVANVWTDALNGFLIRIPDSAAEAIARDPRVVRVEQNSRMFLSATQNTSVPPVGAEPGADSLWGLDRVDQRTSLNESYNYCDDGFGIKIYIVDSGVLKSHQEFRRSSTDATSRVENGVSTTGETFAAPGESADHGTNPCGVLHNSTSGTIAGSHGTSVASIAAGLTTGVAKAATVVPVKVVDCSGNSSVAAVVAGLQWIIQQEDASPYVPKVVNMSMFQWLPDTRPAEICPDGRVAPAISTAELTSLESAVRNVVAAGVTVVVSANNQNQDARNVSPARLAYGNTALPGPHVITVGGTMLVGGVDARWVSGNPTFSLCTNTDAGSNWGPAVDVFAPAADITAAAIADTGTTPLFGYRTASHGRAGTSWAAPFASGMAARFLLQNGAATPLDVWQWMQNLATYDVIDTATLNGSPNRLLYRGGAVTCRIRP